MNKYIRSFVTFIFIMTACFSVRPVYASSVDNVISSNSVSENDTSDEWMTMLINKQHPLPEDYEFTTAAIKGRRGYLKVDERIAPSYEKMAEDAAKEGIDLYIISAHRDIKRQRTIFNKKIANYRKKYDISYLEAYKRAAQEITIPGTSEHEAGLALDITCKTYTLLNEGFGETDAGKWLNEHSYEYGFILRYPKGKEFITGIEYEPWHFRYVGEEAAKVIKENDWTLEEYVRAD